MNNKDKIYNDFEDALFRAAVHRAAETEGERLLLEDDFMDGVNDIGERRVQFQALLDQELKKRKHENPFRTKQALRKGAIVLAAVFILFAISMISVSAFRNQVFSFVLDITEKYTIFHLQENEGGSSDQLIEDWENAYMPTYVPEGYETGEYYFDSDTKLITFIHSQDENQNIYYSEYTGSSTIALDTENADKVEPVDIRGNEGMVVLKGDRVTIIWAIDDKMFTLFGYADQEIMLKIAESVVFIDSKKN